MDPSIYYYMDFVGNSYLFNLALIRNHRQNHLGEQLRRFYGHNASNANSAGRYSWSVRTNINSEIGHQYEKTFQCYSQVGARKTREA